MTTFLHSGTLNWIVWHNVEAADVVNQQPSDNMTDANLHYYNRKFTSHFNKKTVSFSHWMCRSLHITCYTVNNVYDIVSKCLVKCFRRECKHTEVQQLFPYLITKAARHLLPLCIKALQVACYFAVRKVNIPADWCNGDVRDV